MVLTVTEWRARSQAWSTTPEEPVGRRTSLRYVIAASKEEWKGASTLQTVVNAGPVLLVPLCDALLKVDTSLIGRLARWRATARAAYPDDPDKVDETSYLLWYHIYYLCNDLRLIWLIYPHGDLAYPVGHMGCRLDRQPYPDWELDAVLRGEDACPGAMTAALHAITAMVGGHSCAVHPKPDNAKGIAWYERQGFHFTEARTSTLYPYLWEMRLQLPLEEARG